jgi:cobalt-zinc-cadmium efflux system outer membrane protein
VPLAALLLALGCATSARRDIGATKDAVNAVEATPLPANLVKDPARGATASRSASRSRSGIVLTGAEEDAPPVPAPNAQTKSVSGGLEDRLKVPRELPGADVQNLRLPRQTPGNKQAYDVAMHRLFPTLTDPPPFDIGTPEAALPKVSLAELEMSALANSPIIAQYQSDITQAQGLAIQAGTAPNPIIGYEADTVGSFQTRNYQGIYASQLIKSAGKLEVQQAIQNVDLMNAQLALRQARIDLLTQVRRQYFALLVARESVKINAAIERFTHRLYRIQVDQVELGGQTAVYEPMQLRTIAVQSRGNLVAARQRYVSAWKQLTATLNLPEMPLSDLIDDPELSVPQVDYDTAITHILSTNTEVRAARNGPLKARLQLRLAEITPIPDLYAYGTIQRDFTQPGTPHFAYNTQIGMPIPVFDQNKGNILAARGALVRATEEVPRVQNDLRARLADAFERFDTNRYLVGTQHDQILPDAVRTYRGTAERHIQSPEDVGFADVVVAQQNMLNFVSAYLTALGNQWNAFIDIAGLLQADSLEELKLKLRSRDEVPPAARRENSAQDVGTMMADLLAPPAERTADEVAPAGKQDEEPARASLSDLVDPDGWE